MVGISLNDALLIQSLMFIALILAFLAAISGIRSQHFHKSVIRLFTAYFLCGLAGILMSHLMDASLIGRQLDGQVLIYLLSSLLFLLAVCEAARTLRNSLLIIAAHILLAIVILWGNDRATTLLLVSGYDFTVYPWLAFVSFRRAWNYRNVGNGIIGAAALLPFFAAPVQFIAGLDITHLNLAYTVSIAMNSTAFVLVGIGFLTTVLVAEQKQLLVLALNDPLTGLLNRRGMDQALAVPLAQQKRSEACISAIAADIDHFKDINDRYGHDAGDTVLKEFSTVFGEYVRHGDVCCRLGGEEFVIIAFGVENAVAVQIAERIRRHVASLEIDCNSTRISLTCSFGVATHCGQVDLDHLLKDADKALYTAKSQGRDKVCTV